METIEEEGKKHSTVLRTFRLSSTLDAALRKDALRKKVGKNALVTSILDKYVEWDSIVADFGYLTVPPEMIAKLIGGLDKESIISIAKQVSKKVAASLPLWYGKADLEAVLKYMEISIKYTGARMPQRIERQSNVIHVFVYQPYDDNGAAWVRAFNTTLIESVLGYPPKIVEHENSLETIIELKEVT
jgi:hypothetical protein